MTKKAVIIREYEEIINGSRKFDKATDNWTMLKAYESNKETGNERLDFHNVIWDEDLKPIADTLRKSGIKEFTISVHQGDLIDILVAFQELGIFVTGTVKVNTRYKEAVSAILMQVA